MGKNFLDIGMPMDTSLTFVPYETFRLFGMDDNLGVASDQAMLSGRTQKGFILACKLERNQHSAGPVGHLHKRKGQQRLSFGLAGMPSIREPDLPGPWWECRLPPVLSSTVNSSMNGSGLVMAANPWCI